MWVTNAGSRTVTKLAKDGTVLGKFEVGLTPLAIAFDGESMWVINFNGNSVTRLRARDGAKLGTFPVRAVPSAAARISIMRAALSAQIGAKNSALRRGAKLFRP
jgi:DNA-binding beta-propeller fold protein YncE